MKPIRLVISGLHSFREPQEIPFDALSTAGVFGIFGPTGSGKSTILDALTLALYGTVGRAEHNTRGILNHAEKSLMVSLVFEVGTHSKRNTYRVERSYKRKDDVSVQNTRSRLVEVHGEGESVLADKDSEVTAGVKNILGLEPEDFTRAVVLPQGKFAEFLNLRGADRNKMLERLFSLEKYGDALNQRLRARLDAAEREHDRIVAMQQGIGEASLEAVEQAESAVQAAKVAEHHAKQELDQARGRSEKTKQIWDRQLELANAEAALKQHRLRAKEIQSFAEQLDKGNRALRVLPSMRAVEQAQQDYAVRNQEWETVHRKVLTWQQQLAETSRQLAKVTADRTEREATLLAQQARLADAQTMETSLPELDAAMQAKFTAYNVAKEAYEQTNNRAVTLAGHWEQGQEHLVKLRQAVQENMVSTETRAKLHTLRQKSEAFVTVCQRQDQMREDAEAREQVYAQLRQAAEQAQARLAHIRTQLAFIEQQAAEADATGVDTAGIHDRERVLDKLQSVVKQWAVCEDQQVEERQKIDHFTQQMASAEEALQVTVARYEEALRRQEAVLLERDSYLERDRQRLSAQLASDLQAGEACPVCGSTTHPRLATARHAEDAGVLTRLEAEASAAQSELNQLVAQLTQHKEHVAKRKAMLENAQETLVQLENRVDLFRTEAMALDGQAPSSSLQALAAWIVEQQTQVTDLRGAAERLTEANEARQQQVQVLAQAVADAQATAAAASANAQNALVEWRRAQELLQQTERQRTAAESDFAIHLTEFGVECGDLRVDGVRWVETAVTTLASKDKRFEQLQRQVQETQSRLDELVEQRDRLQQEMETSRVGLHQTQITLEADKQRRREITDQLRKLTGGVPVAQALQAVSTELRQLQVRLEKAEEEHRTAVEELKLAENAATAAATRRQSAVEAVQQREADLGKKLTEEQFVTVGEVVDAQLDVREMQEKQDQVQAYAQAETRLVAERDGLLKALGDVRISLTEWNDAAQVLQTANDTWKKAVELVGASLKVVEELRTRHTLWMGWETQRVACAQVLSRLTTLKQLFSGNKFVEFMAQEQMTFVARHASDRLKQLTRNRYALEIAADGRFVMRDDHNGGVKRPVSTLSGGETFLTSLALALSLSTQIQLRGEYPLEFFFLDEGFGTLDPELLDVVMSALEKLHMEQMTIGIISHVPELRQRMQRRLIVEPAEAGGRGTRLRMEFA